MLFAKTLGLFACSIFLTFSLSAQVDYDASHTSVPDVFPSNSLGRHTQTVSGAVSNFNGTPAKDAEVELRSIENGNVVVSAYTNLAGRFEMSNVPAGHYVVVVQLGLASASQQLALDGADPNVSLRLPQEYADRDAGNANSVSVAQMKVPERARKLLRKAEEAVSKQDLDNATKYIAEALQAYPRYAGALTLRGILKLDTHDYATAKSDMEEAIQCDSSYPLAYMALGATYNMLQRWDDAIQTLNHGIGLDAASWQGYFELGKSYIAKADYQSALKNLTHAESLAPKYWNIHLLKAHAMMGMKDYSNAMTELETYLVKEPNGAASAQARDMLDKAKAFVAMNK